MSEPVSYRPYEERHLPMMEARCMKCGEAYNPSGEEETALVYGIELVEHYQQFGPNENGEYETECGGFGLILGEWR